MKNPRPFEVGEKVYLERDFVGYASKEEAEEAKLDNPYTVSEIKEIEFELEEEG